MIINTLLKYNFTADIYVPRIDINNSQTIYMLLPNNTNVRVNVVSGRTQTTMFTKDAVEYGARILQVRNPEGRLLFVEGGTNGEEEYQVHVHTVLPVVDIYGTITGYRSVLRRPQPVLTDVKPTSDPEA